MGETAKKRRLSEGSENLQDTDVTKSSPQQDVTAQTPASRKPRRELFVRSLPTSATSESLAEYFSQSYVIKHAFVVNDTETKQSKGYGFVTFADLEDAQNALEEFNGSVFDGKKIKVDYAEPRHREIDGELGKSVPSSDALRLKQEREQQKESTQPPKLIVRNLPWSIKEPEDLAVHFRSFGKVKYATIPKRGNKLAGFGFVVLRGKKNAEKALENVNGKEVDGRTLAVDWAVEKSVWENLQKESLEQEEGKENEDDKDDIEMAEDDEESDASSEDKDPGSDEGMEDLEEDEEDEDEEDADEEEDERNAMTIFIRNLPFTCTDEALYEHFKQFGRLQYARTVVDPETERPRGTGFVCFRNIEDAVSCVRDAPKQTDTIAQEKGKGGKASTAVKHSVLQNEHADPTGRYTLDGRVLQVARAVSRSQAAKLEEEGASRRFDRDKDKRRVFLLSEGTIPTNSALYKKLSPSEIKMREDSFKQRQSFIKKNPTLHLSLTRLSVRNIPRHVSSKDLKALAREAVVGFAKDVKSGVRLPLSKEELRRSAEAMKEAEHLRKKKRQGIVRQAKVVFEGRDGSKVGEESGAGRSRGYGFIEYFTHRHALMGLRWLNGHAAEPSPTAPDEVKDRKKRLIVEFAIENAQVVKRRNEYQAKARSFAKTGQQNDKTGNAAKSPTSDNTTSGKKRKRSDNRANGKAESSNGNVEEENKIAKRNRVIAKKRMQRKSRKGKA
ncbi:Nucleolar protein [Aspergillus sclerotialis]|uniref:Nucleolar protein n=1 Tax=Aspergillus sclerotialis TaxID=2070753 RepID=A0A3A2ZS48_9EURO|nr:Nucleolar protein [Aspergillus sclerotialis]